MSMYRESRYNQEKNNIYDEICEFLKNHPISELLNIIADAIDGVLYDSYDN